MLDIGWTELLVIGALALIVVGPKDLPGMLRNVGRIVGKARGMAREFQGAMEDAAREADVKEFTDIKKDMNKWSDTLGSANPKKYAEKFMTPDSERKTPEPGSHDAADDVENAAWEAEQAEKARLAAKAAADAERSAAIDRSAAELEGELAKERDADEGGKPSSAA